MADPDFLPLEVSVLEVDPSLLQALISIPAARGVAFTTLADEQMADPTSWLARFCELDNATRAGDPNVPRTIAEMAERLKHLGVVAEAVILAKHGGQYVGYTCLDPKSSNTISLQQSWTGVRPSHRRWGIATALKALGIEYARAHGYRRIVTSARRTNAASIRMSLKVGYAPTEPTATPESN